MLGLFLIFCALFLLLGLLSYDANDPSINYVKSGVVEVKNKAGLFGAYAAGLLNDFFGIGALVCPCIFAALGVAHVLPSIILRWWRWAGFFLLTVCLLVIASAADLSIGDLSGGGMVGRSLDLSSVRYLSPFGSFLLWLFVLLTGVQLAANFSWISVCQNFWRSARAYWAHHLAKFAKSRQTVPGQAASREPQTASPASQVEPMSHADEAVGSSLPLLDKFVASAASFTAARAEKLKTTLQNWLSRKQPLPMPDLAPGNDDKPDAHPEIIRVPTPVMELALTDADSQISEDAALPAGNGDDDIFAPAQILAPEMQIPAMQPEAAAGRVHRVGEQDRGVTAAAPPAPVPMSGCLPENRLDNHILASTIIDSPVKTQAAKVDTRLFREPPEFVFPSPDLLNPPQPMPAAEPEDLETKGRALMTCFNDFDIQGQLARITPGPVVTMFEVRPAAGIRVSKIANLADDLSLALKAVAVRIQAPIPGSDTVGIEIPNDLRETVNFRELVESREFAGDKGQLTMILGKNIAGHPYLADLTRMPHMLVAGATGAGKSVCLNSILVSLLYKMPPDKMRLLLVDPKRIELAVYADLPHLVHPVVTEMDDAKNALDWAVQDMKTRYKTFERMGVRNIVAYHEKLASFGGMPPAGLEDMKPMPYMVIVIDELADLMMTAARDVETSIVRLAQLARAAGIHMILATQRPSVDVVTGLIKANFPCRISFQVTSKHDSRTILDQVGAEHLLGRGDMLFKPSGGKLIRLHGPFLTDEEVQTVANHWKEQMPPSYEVDFSQWSAETAQASPSVGGDATSDPLYAEARSFVLDHGRASISLLQRHLKIGFNRSARLMEQFEREGLIGPADGSKPRNVIR